ncbi:helix-turn-helix domain-containing protein [Vibrio vulnificus]|uniref:helix-turn-helix domain-containing protein n=1 Tax=Vibrio vulnificus TaxID=672 RepID=UPI003ED9C218
MLRILAWLLLAGLTLPFKVLALDGNSAIFYPLPGQEQGTFVAAKNLFVGGDGGLWIHDVHGKVQYFDGNTLLPKRGSLLEYPSEQVAFHQGSFWTFVANEVFQTYPNQKRQLAFSLNPGAEIRKIGSSDGHIWVSDGINFYDYDIESKELKTYSLLSLYQNNQSSYVYINDAKRVLSKWVLGTTSGAYLSQGEQFTHIKASAKHFVAKLYFSPTRRELLVGTLNGAALIDILKPTQKNIMIGESHVLSMTETNQEYWIGTEHGLYSYSFLTGQVAKVKAAGAQDVSPDNRKIYSLVNDEQGGIWVATNSGILYYSLFGRKFERLNNITEEKASRFNGNITKIVYASDETIWFKDANNLYRAIGVNKQYSRVRLPIKVNDFALEDGNIWIASEQGLYIYDTNQYKLRSFDLPSYLKGKEIDFVSVSPQGKVWISSGYRLAAIGVADGRFQDYGDRWIASQNLPARILGLEVDQKVPLIVRTDHGAYVLENDKIRFERNTQSFGESVDIAEAKDGSLWFAGTHGIYRKDPTEKTLGELALPQENVKPICLITDASGIWMVSSIGLSFYNFDGALRKHFGSRSGIMSNEFVEGSCAASFGEAQSGSVLVLGSKHGLVFADRDDLMVSKLPEPRVVISQVRIDDQVANVGQKEWQLPELAYGSAISFGLGVMPNAYGETLYYRLNQEHWQTTEAGQVSFEHLAAGDYLLSVKTSLVAGDSVQVRFTVLHPWYQTTMAMAIFVLLIVALGGLVVFWRSRYVSVQNRELTALVALKTNQLRHQSRVLLTSNQQLRKQIQVRNLLVDNVARSLRQSVDALLSKPSVEPASEYQEHQMRIAMLLEELKSSPSDGTDGYLQNFNVSHIIQSVVDVWEDELSKIGVQVHISSESDDYRVAVGQFNLDVIFNSVFASVLKRAYRGQMLDIVIREQNDFVEVSFIDFGQPFSTNTDAEDSAGVEPAKIDTAIEKLPALVEQSGGRLSLFSSAERNKIEILWPKAVESLINDEEPSVFVDSVDPSPVTEVSPEGAPSPEQLWLAKVEAMVAEHYTNPEFGTAMAAKMLYVSERSLQRRFKSASSRTFTDYLTEVRLEKACESLLAGEKVVDVAFASGFNDPSYFSQRFKLYFGVPPSKFASDALESE